MIHSIVDCFRGLAVFCLTSFLDVCVRSSCSKTLLFQLQVALKKMACVCCTELLYWNEILGNNTVSFIDKTC